MNRKFAPKGPTEMGVCVHIPYRGLYCCHYLYLSSVKMGNKGGRKCSKSGGNSNKYPWKHQHQNQHDLHHQHQHQHQHQCQCQQQQQNNLKQTNLNREILESIDVKPFSNVFTTDHSQNTTWVVFQNSGPQPESKYSIKAKQGSSAMSNGNYDIILFAETWSNSEEHWTKSQLVSSDVYVFMCNFS